MNLVDIVKEKFETALHQVLIEKITPNVNEHIIEYEGEEYVLIFGKKSEVARDGGLADDLVCSK